MLKLGPELFECLNTNQVVGNQQPVIYGKGGLSVLQIRLIESQLGFPIPEDFSYLLQNMRDPGGVLFPWSNFKRQKYDDMIAWIRKGIEFDIEVNDLWLRRWGERPAELSAALDKARRDFVTWPKLLPVYGHRFLAAEPCCSDNPVFSIMQTDKVCYGANLAHYLVNEFVQHNMPEHVLNQEVRKIDIWSDFLRENRDAFLSEGNVDTMAQTLAAARKFLTDPNVAKEPAVKIELAADGNVLIADELILGQVALEAKLHELVQQSPPPAFYVQRANDDVGAELFAAIGSLLGKMGFVPIVVVQRQGNEMKAFNGWGLG